MRNLTLTAAILLSLTIFSATASTMSKPEPPLILTLNSDTIYSTGVLIIGGQASPNQNISIKVQRSDQTVQTLETISDRDGHFKVNLINAEPLSPGFYAVKATTITSSGYNSFTVVDESTRLCSDLEQTVKRTRSEAEAVYKMLDSVTTLASDMNTNIQKGNSYYEEAQNNQKSGETAKAIEAYHFALQAYSEALHFKELISSSKQPSPEAILVMELLEKIRRLNDTITDFTNQTNQRTDLLESVKTLLHNAEKQLSLDNSAFEGTLEKLVVTMEMANQETQKISASTTLSQRLEEYKELQVGVQSLEKMMFAKRTTSPILHPMLFDYIEKLKSQFEIINWIEAVSNGKPYTTPEPVKPQVDKERLKLLNTEIEEFENKLRSLVENENDSTSLAIIYKAWDYVKEARLCMLNGDANQGEPSLIQARTILESFK